MGWRKRYAYHCDRLNPAFLLSPLPPYCPSLCAIAPCHCLNLRNRAPANGPPRPCVSPVDFHCCVATTGPGHRPHHGYLAATELPPLAHGIAPHVLTPLRRPMSRSPLGIPNHLQLGHHHPLPPTRHRPHAMPPPPPSVGDAKHTLPAANGCRASLPRVKLHWTEMVLRSVAGPDPAIT